MNRLEPAFLVTVRLEHLVVQVRDRDTTRDVLLHEGRQSLQTLLFPLVLPSQSLLHVRRLDSREHRALLVVLFRVVVVIKVVLILSDARFVHRFAWNVLLEGRDAGGDASLAHLEVGVVVWSVLSINT